MTDWTAIVPLKAVGRKTRLAPGVAALDRDRLAEAMLERVLTALRASRGVGRIVVLSPDRPAAADIGWAPDHGRGLNAELQAADPGGALLVIHADLPLVTAEDVDALLAAAQAGGGAIAPDRHGLGTNALALADGFRLRLAFGVGSFAAHRAQAPDALTAVTRPGLALDVDTMDDLDAAVRGGFALPA